MKKLSHDKLYAPPMKHAPLATTCTGNTIIVTTAKGFILPPTLTMDDVFACPTLVQTKAFFCRTTFMFHSHDSAMSWSSLSHTEQAPLASGPRDRPISCAHDEYPEHPSPPPTPSSRLVHLARAEHHRSP